MFIELHNPPYKSRLIIGSSESVELLKIVWPEWSARMCERPIGDVFGKHTRTRSFHFGALHAVCVLIKHLIGANEQRRTI